MRRFITAFGSLSLLILAMLAVQPVLHARSSPADSLAGATRDLGAGPRSSFFGTLIDLLESAGQLVVHRLGPGQRLEDPVAYDSLESPRHTVLSFYEAMEKIEFGHREAWPVALRTLEKTEETPTALRAKQLKAVLDRFGNIDPMRLPGPTDVKERGMTRYELFPRGLNHTWVWRELGGAPAGTLVLDRDRDGKWRFSLATVRNLGRLHNSMVKLPPRFESGESGELFLSTFTPTVEHTDWWEVLALLGCLIGGIALGWGLLAALRRLGLHLEHRRRRRLAQTVRSLGGPVAFLLFSLGLGAGLAFIHLDGTLSRMRWSLLSLLAALGIGWLIYRLLDLMAVIGQRRMGESNRIYHNMTLRVLRSGLQVFAIAVVIAFLAEKVFNVELGTLLLGLGIVGLVLSLAGKDSVKNLFGAITIFVNRPFQVGDWVQFDGYVGEVEDVSMQATRIRLLSGHLATIPNMRFIDTEVENFMERSYIRRIVNLPLALHTPSEQVNRAVAIIRRVLCEDEEVLHEGLFELEQLPSHVSVTDFGEYFVNIRAYYCYRFAEDGRNQRSAQRGWYDYLDHCTLVNRKIIEALNEAGIRLALPAEHIRLDAEAGWHLSRTGDGSGRGRSGTAGPMAVSADG